jgi:hypothetical protein
MRNPVTYEEALRAVRQDRKEREKEDRGHYPRKRNDRMVAAERDRLGALLVEFLSQYAEVEPSPAWGVEFVLETDLGPLITHYDVRWGTIFQRFQIPTNKVPGSNPYSGKWNFHHDYGTTADEAFLEWRNELARVYRRPPT